MRTDIKEEFRVIPKSDQVVVGDSTVLQCNAPKSLPEATVHWIKDGQQLNLSTSDDHDHLYAQSESGLNRDSSLDAWNRLKLLSSGSLRISNVQLTDQGTYTCVANNMAATRESPPALLTVYSKYFFLLFSFSIFILVILQATI